MHEQFANLPCIKSCHDHKCIVSTVPRCHPYPPTCINGRGCYKYILLPLFACLLCPLLFTDSDSAEQALEIMLVVSLTVLDLYSVEYNALYE